MPEIALDDSINDALPVDSVGNIAYEARFQHQRTLQWSVAGLLAAVTALSITLAWQSHRPPTVLVVRVDEAGRATPIRYDALQFTPREGEIRARLNDWAIDRYRLLKAVAGDSFKLNYDFLSADLGRRLMSPDAAHLAKILAGSEPEQDVQIDNIQFTSLSNQRLPDGAVASGEAVIDMTRTAQSGAQTDPQHWTVTVRYEVDPVAAARRGETDPQFLNVNPLGVTITWFHEDRAFR